MQLMSDAITVLGSRHGIFIQPTANKANLIRCERFPGLECEIKAGIEIGGKRYVLPLCADDEKFSFIDQDCAPCAIKLTGIHPGTGLKLELALRIPFRPRDAAFSTIPIIDVVLKLTSFKNRFRWDAPEDVEIKGKIFFEVSSPNIAVTESIDGLELSFDVDRPSGRGKDAINAITQRDCLVLHKGGLEGTAFVADFEDPAAAEIHASWCTWSDPMLVISDDPAPFKYTEKFGSLADVISWAQANPTAIQENARNVDAILQCHNLSRSTDNMMALTLHSWLANTWWTKRGEQDIYTVWEGSCYYHSTVDVEYTQTPFYLAVWPELLALELDLWPEFVVEGSEVLGEAGKGTTMFMHDMGQACCVDTTRYNHHMPVEENTNYILMSYGYWKRSGDDSRVKRHAEIMMKALDFVKACDTTGNGVPDKGMANTIDDASPAVQFGKEQIYLAVKAMAAFEVGAEMMEHAGMANKNDAYQEQAKKIADVIKEKGWQEDHFVTLLDKAADGVFNSWNDSEYSGDELPGWDAAHIYTANGLALLDMVGCSVDIDEERLYTDLQVATERCLDKHGCRHSDYDANITEEIKDEGGSSVPTCRIGWISMNMLRDISAFYRGIDLRALTDRYWEYQVLVNTQGPHLFFETFNGNNLMCYPRGIAIFGYFDALAGLQVDMVEGTMDVEPIDNQLRVPILLLADWEKGEVPLVDHGELVE